MEIHAADIIGALLLAGILWVVRTAQKIDKQVAVLSTVLTGQNGDNGIMGEVKHLRSRQHDLANEVHTVHGRVDLVEFRVDALENAS